MRKLRNVLSFISDLDIVRTIIFNFKVLPFPQAIKMPIWIGRRYKVFKLSEIHRGG